MGNPIEGPRLITAISPISLFSSRTGLYVSLKNTNKAYCVIQISKLNTQAAPTIYPFQATAVAGTGAKVFSTANPLDCWLSNAVSSDDTLTKQTAGANFATAASSGTQQCIIAIEPGSMDLANGFDCLGIQISATTSSDIVSAQYWLDMRYAESDTPTVLAD